MTRNNALCTKFNANCNEIEKHRNNELDGTQSDVKKAHK